eukprot:35122_1
MTGAHVDGRGVARLQFARDIQDLHLGREGASGLQGVVLRKDHHVPRAGHVRLHKALHVQAHIVSGAGLRDGGVVHFDAEYLAPAAVGTGVRGQKDDLVLGLHDALLDAARHHVAAPLDRVETGHRHAHRFVCGALGEAHEPVEGLEQRVAVQLFPVDPLHVAPRPPRHVFGLLQQVVALPAGQGKDGNVLFDEVLLPPQLLEHSLHFGSDLVVALLFVGCHVAVHFVHGHNELLDAQQVEQAAMLPRLALDLARLVVALGDGRREVPVSRYEKQRHVGLRGTSDHVLDEVTVPGGVDDGVVPVRGEK